jgi:hypothetical protein
MCPPYIVSGVLEVNRSERGQLKWLADGLGNSSDLQTFS